MTRVPAACSLAQLLPRHGSQNRYRDTHHQTRLLSVEAVPETRYATTPDDLRVAYQIVGDGPVDLVFMPGWYTNVEAQWEEPLVAHFLRRLASFSRLLVFDKRGTGLSDPVSVADLPPIEEWSEDVVAVMDAADSQRAVIFGTMHGGPMALMFAATFPERAAALVVANAFARLARAADYPAGVPRRVLDERLQHRNWEWGTPVDLAHFNPSLAGNERVREWWARFERVSASPGTARAMRRMIFALDVRPALSVISVPTLVLHRRDSQELLAAHGRYLASNIRDAKYVELPGGDTLFFAGNADALLDEVELFVTGVRRGPEPDRVLAAVMFTDIVGSTEYLARVGDRHWGQLVARHDALTRAELERFRGREVRATGDGFLAIFDGPGRAVRCACAIRDAVRKLGIEVRVGIHTGEVERQGDEIGGIGVHIAARVSALAEAGEVLASRTIVDLVVGSGIEFQDRGEHQLKGVHGTWRLYAVEA